METNDRILIAIGDLREDIGGLRADVRHALREVDAQDKRVGSLEKSRTHFGGIVAGVSLITTLVVSGAAYALQFFPLR